MLFGVPWTVRGPFPCLVSMLEYIQWVPNMKLSGTNALQWAQGPNGRTWAPFVLMLAVVVRMFRTRGQGDQHKMRM